MNHKSTLLAITLSCGLAFAADSAAGHYSLVGGREVGSELLLKPDGNFEFMLAYGALDLLAQGTWRQEGDEVVLNTRTNDDPLFRQTRNGSAPAFRVTVMGAAGRGVEHIDVVVKVAGGGEARHEKTDHDGSAVFPDVHSARSVSFHVPVYDVDAGPFPLDAMHNDFEFLINGEAITQVPFKNERLKVNGKNLELKFFDQDKPMVYRRS